MFPPLPKDTQQADNLMKNLCEGAVTYLSLWQEYMIRLDPPTFRHIPKFVWDLSPIFSNGFALKKHIE